MHAPFRKSATMRVIATSAATLAVLAVSGNVLGVSQSGEKMNMNRLGHTDLQGRPSYQPNVIQYPDGRYIAFAGMHSGVPVPVPACSGSLPNPLNGNACEINGTMLIDVTDPRNPFETAHIPSPAGGQTQSERMCLGSQLPHGTVQVLRLLLFCIRRPESGGNSIPMNLLAILYRKHGKKQPHFGRSRSRQRR